MQSFAYIQSVSIDVLLNEIAILEPLSSVATQEDQGKV